MIARPALNRLLGIDVSGNRLVVADLRRSGRSVRVEKAFQKTLALDPASADPQLAGREIRNLLDAEGIRPGPCIVSIPVEWGLAVMMDIPAIAGEDLQGYLSLKIDRELPMPSADPTISMCSHAPSGGSRRALVAAAPTGRVQALARTIRAAGLRPVGVTFGIAEIAAMSPAPRTVLLASADYLEMCVVDRGGPVALRSLHESIVRTEDGDRAESKVILREWRITMSDIESGDESRLAEVWGQRRIAGIVAEGLGAALGPAGARVVTRGSGELGVAAGQDLEELPPGAVVSAARRLRGEAPVFNFLPPKRSRLRTFATRVSARRAAWAAGAVGGVALLLLLAFVWQGLRLASLESRWAAVEPRATQVEALQERVRSLRPWYDDSVPSLEIARGIAGAFPEDGAVWVKTLEVDALSKVSCTGEARSNRDWLAMLNNLRSVPGVENVQVQQVRGADSIQFRLSFDWKGGAV